MNEHEEHSITVVVNGDSYPVRANLNQQISVIIKQALREAEQTGRPAEDWELRAGDSDQAQVLEPNRKLRDYALTLPITLFLNLQTGGGGGIG